MKPHLIALFCTVLYVALILLAAWVDRHRD